MEYIRNLLSDIVRAFEFQRAKRKILAFLMVCAAKGIDDPSIFDTDPITDEMAAVANSEVALGYIKDTGIRKQDIAGWTRDTTKHMINVVANMGALTGNAIERAKIWHESTKDTGVWETFRIIRSGRTSV